MGDYAIYLRKSRIDVELEAQGKGETLQRHAQRLYEFSKKQGYHIVAEYREVKSGESISGRPEVQRLLEDVSAGKYAGVIVVSEDRLGRGDGVDQAVIQKVFADSGTKIITPDKVIDLEKGSDEMSFSIMQIFSRFEYRKIKERQYTGRVASAKEGKTCGGPPPYGYRRIKLDGQKGYTLESIPDQAAVVRRIYDMWLSGDGLHKIAVDLTRDGIRPANVQEWKEASINSILKNPVYCGKIKFGGKVYSGLHTGIVTADEWEAAQKRWSTPRVAWCKTPVNPWSGIIYCKQCGHAMVSHWDCKRKKRSIKCCSKLCDTMSVDISYIEPMIFASLREKLAELELPPEERVSNLQEFETLEQRKKAAIADRRKIATQKRKAYDLVEQEVYTADVFKARMEELTVRDTEAQKRIDAITLRIEELRRAEDGASVEAESIRVAIDLYDGLTDPMAKNRILKGCIKRIDYSRPKGTRRTDIRLNICYLI